MNEKIKQLAIEAGFESWGDERQNPGEIFDWSSSYDKELQKFAELLVTECAKMCVENEHFNKHSVASEWAIKAAESFKKQFGVGV